MFSLRLFGTLSLVGEEGPVTGAAVQRRRLALLALLGAARDGGLSRDALVGLLWPDTPPDQARRFLADSLYTLRRSLGADAIRTAGDNLELAGEVVRCDVMAFREALARGNDEEAAALYTGAFLDGFFVPDSAEFEQWADGVRAELAQSWSQAVERLARAAEDAGHPEEAAARWRQLQTADPLNSRVALQLMVALAAAGDPAAALRHFRLHEALLRAELDLGVPEAIASFAERLRVSAGRDARAEQAGEVKRLAAHEPAAFTPPRAPGPAAVRAPVRPLHAAALALGLLAAAVVAVAWWPSGGERARVLVLALENRTGDDTLQPVGAMAADWIARGLMETPELEVLSPTWSPAPANGGRVGTGVRTAVSGAYYLDGGRLRMEVQIVEPRRGSVLQALEPVHVARDSASAGVEVLRQRVAAALAARHGALRELKEITGRVQPPTFAAYSDYVEGVQLFSRFQNRQAAERFARAWAADTTFHLAALYEVLSAYNSGHTAHGDSMVRMLLPRRSRMAAFDRGLLDAFDAEMRGHTADVLQAMRQVAARAPGSQFAVGHAVAAVAAGRPREALHALEALDADAGLLRGNARYWDWLTATRHLLGHHRRELRVVRRMRTEQPGLNGSAALEVRALAARGKTAELTRLIQGSAAGPTGAGTTPADLLLLASDELRAHGHPADAARFLDEAIARYRSTPAQAWPAQRAALARALYRAERWLEAGALLEELASDQPHNVHITGQLAALAARTGDLPRARTLAAAIGESATPRTRATHTLWRARIAAAMGEHERALELLGTAFAEGAARGLWLHTDPHFAGLDTDSRFRAWLRTDG